MRKFNLVVFVWEPFLKDTYFVLGSRNVTQIEREVAKIVLSCCQIHLNAIWHNWTNPFFTALLFPNLGRQDRAKQKKRYCLHYWFQLDLSAETLAPKSEKWEGWGILYDEYWEFLLRRSGFSHFGGVRTKGRKSARVLNV